MLIQKCQKMKTLLKKNTGTNTEYPDYKPHFDNFDYMGAYKKVRELGRPLTEEELEEVESE